MYFKEIQLVGFKSFANKIEIKFDNGITAIVGPNGCGKSNVGDAIRWVLGEQSSKSLRGTSMQDVIFSGTEKRKSLSYCEVNLHFNNSDRFFDVDYDELMVTRKLYRSGESEYQINKNQCRLKDIVNLFFDSGIGRDGYSIISQGKVEEIISSKPETRRLIFEEASGIAKFKVRKIEAERKLERTRENLVRIKDIVGELERQLGPLKKQAETAKKYLEFRQLLKDLEINAYIFQYENMGDVKLKINTKIDAILEEMSQRQVELVGLNQKYNSCMEDIDSIDENIKKLNNEILLLTVGLEKQMGESKLLQERISNIKNQNEKTNIDILNYENIIIKNKAEKDFKEKRKNDLEVVANKIENSSGEYAKMLKEYANLKVAESNFYASLKEEEQNFSDLNAKIQVCENRRRLLVEMQEEFECYAFAVKKLLKESEKNAYLKDKIVGVFAELIKVPEKFEIAIDVSLGSAVQNIVTLNEENAKNLINYLKQNQLGRATFMPISSMKPRYLSTDDKRILSTKGCFGIASELIKFDSKIKNVVENLLGATVLVDTLETAINMAKNSRFSFKIVTLDGDIINPTGSMTGGSKKSNAVNLISRDREIKTLADTLETCKTEYINKKEKISKLMLQIANAKSQIEELEKKKNSTEISEAVQIAEIRTEINAIEKDFVRIETQIAESQKQIENGKNQIKQNCAFVEQEESKIKVLLENTINVEAQGKLDAIKLKQEQQEQSKMDLQEKLKEINIQKDIVLNQINEINNKKYKVEMELAKLSADTDSMQERIFEEYELTYETCKEFKKPNFDINSALPEIANLKREITKLGYVNVNAIEDSKAIFERYEDLSTQVQDLEKAETDTNQIISDLAKEMSTKFETEFNKINDNFKITFKELFGGGNAHLELVGNDNILEAGVDIVAEPPGKKLQNISLLSGGEKALTAIAILFAILKLKPMPFCLLDEIEAALDDANVERFAQYLRRFSNETQFIVITHRKPTMELADSLYGVTMEEKGVSSIVSVKLSDAIKNIAQEVS
ncbi:MAG: hypothetical protein PHQ62_00765 [Clostridia bacterium]|nr:hypothetical protein [Clostridia bacterium]